MNRKECLEILKNKNHPQYNELHHIYYTNYNNAKKFFNPLIDDMRKERPGVNIVLHHIVFNDQNYEDWDTVVPLYNDEHLEIHAGSKDTQCKRSNSMKRVWSNEEFRENISTKMTEKWLDIEYRNKISESRKGHFVSKETRYKISKSNIGKKRSVEVKNKISESRKGKKYPNRKRLSEEDRKKLSESHKGIKQSSETIEKRRQKCIGQKREKQSQSLKLSWQKRKAA